MIPKDIVDLLNEHGFDYGPGSASCPMMRKVIDGIRWDIAEIMGEAGKHYIRKNEKIVDFYPSFKDALNDLIKFKVVIL